MCIFNLYELCIIQYGGNPVSCAIANAVLDVIEKEGLQEHAVKVGNHLLKSLQKIMEKHPIIGE